MKKWHIFSIRKDVPFYFNYVKVRVELVQDIGKFTLRRLICE